ncbi:MAG: hypothetical protein Q8941_20110 [Bacteroidota bacterium]|nr:hypothetical protein [Bacteroidota bacterium]
MNSNKKITSMKLFLYLILLAFAMKNSLIFAQNTTLKNNTVPVNTPGINRSAVVAFKANATIISGQPVASGTPHDVDFTGRALFNESNSFSIDKDEFTAPSDGYYYFEVRVNWNKFSAKGDVVIKLLLNWYSGLPSATWLPGNTDIAVFDTNFSTLMQLKAGDKVRVQIAQDTGAQQVFKQVQFSGFKVN